MKDREPDRVADIRPEYDFSRGVRGKYAQRFQEGSNVVVLDPDVAARFPDSMAVNDALRHIPDSESDETRD
jgi:hypothetical protein